MSFRGLKQVLHNIRRTAMVSGAVPRTDGQLLNAYVVAGDEACFDALMHRYGPMVYGICRRVLGRAQDAEDAFQTTFLVLVRKAAKLRRRDAVGNWLYGVAYRTALQARSRAARRRHKEAEVLPMASEESTADSAGRSELLDLLDRELSRLPDKYRAPIILCELMGKTKKQAAEELRCPEGTISSRLARGRDMLRKRLSRHGSALAVVSGAALLEGTTVHAVPISLYCSTLKAAALVLNGNITAAAGLSPNVAKLLNGVLKSMLLSKLKPAGLVLILATALMGAGATWVAGRTEGVKPAGGAGPLKPAMVAVAVQKPKEEKPAEDGVPKEDLRYGGKAFREWRIVLITDLKPDVRIEAMKALGAFGSNGYGAEATAFIVQTMKKYDWEKLTGEDRLVLDAAWKQLAVIGPNALPALAKEMDGDNVNNRRLAAAALISILREYPKEAWPLFFKAFTDKDRLVRDTALNGAILLNLWNIKPPATLTSAEKQSVVSTSVALLKDGNERMRAISARLVGGLGPDAKPAVPALIDLIADGNPAIKESITKRAKTINISTDSPQIAGPGKSPKKAGKGGKGGPPSGFGDGEFGGVGQPLAKGATTPGGFDPIRFAGGVTNSRYEAVRALGSIGPEAKEAVPVLIGVLEFEGAGIYGAAIESLGRIGPSAGEAVPLLMQALDGSKVAPEVPVVALGRIGPASKAAVPFLLKMAKNETQRFGQFKHPLLEIVVTLGNIGPDAKLAVPRLLEILDARSFADFNGAQLIEMHAAAKEALEKIQR
jgi:RNA polymerase sigma factor (sigma-70 family)